MDRFTWGIVGGAVLLVVVGLLSVTLLQRPPAPPDLATPEGVVRAYIQAIEGGHPEQAWDLLARSARADVTRDEFIRDATPLRRDASGRVTVDRTEVDGSTARVDLTRTYASGGGLFGPSSYSTQTTVRLEREDDQWRIAVPPEPYLIARRPR